MDQGKTWGFADAEAMHMAIDVLRRNGSPIVAPQADGVYVAKSGVWAFGPTLPEALVALDEKLVKLGRV